MEFREPAFLLLAILALPLFWLLQRPSGKLVFSSLALWPKRGSSLRKRSAFVPALLLSLAFVSLCLALAGPRVPGGVLRIEREGIAMLLVVDKSGSMAALDMSSKQKEQDRLEAVKEVLEAFVQGNEEFPGRINDALGLVSFASYPDSDAPLTMDHVTLMQLIKDLQIVSDPNESGTAIGDALGLAAERLRNAKAKSKVVILLTDGVNNTGYEHPLDAARMLQKLGIKCYTIGVGSNGFAPIRVQDVFSGRQILQQIPVEIDEQMLSEIAKMTGGSYFRATNREGLKEIYAQIDTLEKSKINEERYTHYDERYAQWLALAALLLSLGLALRLTLYRRAP